MLAARGVRSRAPVGSFILWGRGPRPAAAGLCWYTAVGTSLLRLLLGSALELVLLMLMLLLGVALLVLLLVLTVVMLLPLLLLALLLLVLLQLLVLVVLLLVMLLVDGTSPCAIGCRVYAPLAACPL